MGRRLSRLALLLLLVAAAGCVAPAARVDRLASDAGMARGEVDGEGFRHVTYERGLSSHGSDELHVYVHGDGTPQSAGRASRDPTPRAPITLELMALDAAPSVLLGRPCYLGRAALERCEPRLWTRDRYAPEVVRSMAAALARYLERYEPAKVVLIGYSGGGALAALLAPALQRPVFLVTIAGNLDTELWTELRGYHPLAGSLNPLDHRLQALPQLHLYGEKDETVPPAVVMSYAGERVDTLRGYAEADHTCCWQQVWSEVLLERPWR